jgi:hypothetical protein
MRKYPLAKPENMIALSSHAELSSSAEKQKSPVSGVLSNYKSKRVTSDLHTKKNTIKF